jgi:hypothetical protein
MDAGPINLRKVSKSEIQNFGYRKLFICDNTFGHSHDNYNLQTQPYCCTLCYRDDFLRPLVGGTLEEKEVPNTE